LPWNKVKLPQEELMKGKEVPQNKKGRNPFLQGFLPIPNLILAGPSASIP